MKAISTRARVTVAILCVASLSIATDRVASQTRRVVRVTAERFTFAPSQIVVDEGEEVELRLKSDDTSHGFRIAGTTVNVAIPKRGHDELSIVLRAPAPGRYVFECTRMCGAGHNFMRGMLIVRARTDR
jgi:cytochrome c oxidase subunit II